MKTQAEFFQEHQVDGELTDLQMAQMLNLPEGDIGAPAPGNPNSSVPDAGTANANPPTPEPEKPESVPPAAAPNPDPAATPVILAKDGVHTISYDKLLEAREAEKNAKAAADAATAEAAGLRQQLEALQKAPAAPAAAPAADPTKQVETPATEGLFGDFSEEAIAKGVETLVEQRVAAITTDLEAKHAAALAPVQKQQQIDAAEAHYSTIYTAHPDADSIAQSAELGEWIKAQPRIVQPAMQAVMTTGSAEDIVELFSAFKAATGKTAAAPAPAPAQVADPAAAARAVIDATKSAPPSSLSELPAGGMAPVDENAAILEMNDASLMKKFEGKSPEQIMALMSKVI